MSDLQRTTAGRTNVSGSVPIDQHGDLLPEQIANQGVNGAPVPFPSVPGDMPGYAPQEGGPVVGLTQPPPSFASPGFEPRGQNELASQFVSRKIAAGQQLTPGDLMALDAEQQAMRGGAGGGSVSSTTSTAVRQNDSEELRRLRAERDRIEANTGERMRQTGVAQEATGLANAQDLAVRADAVRQEAAAAQTRQEEQAAELQRRQGEIDKATADYLKRAQEIDPNRLLHGGKRAIAALAMAFGAAGAAQAHTQNFAQQIISDAVNRDIDAQKTALHARREGLSMAQQAFQNYRAIYQDDAAARAATHAFMNEALANDLGSRAAKLQGTEARANMLNARDQMLLQSNALKQQAAELAAGRVQTSTTTQVGGGGGTPGDIISRLGQYADAAKKLNEQNAAGGPDTQDKVLYNDVAKQAGDYASMIKVGAQVQNLLDKTNGAAGGMFERSTGLTKDSKFLATARDQLKLAIINASSGKAFTEAERQQINDMLEKGAWTNESLKQKLEQVQSYMAGKIQSQIGTLHPAMQAQLATRMQAGGVPKNVLQSMFSGAAAQGTAQQGAALGLRPTGQ